MLPLYTKARNFYSLLYLDIHVTLLVQKFRLPSLITSTISGVFRAGKNNSTVTKTHPITEVHNSNQNVND